MVESLTYTPLLQRTPIAKGVVAGSLIMVGVAAPLGLAIQAVLFIIGVVIFIDGVIPSIGGSILATILSAVGGGILSTVLSVIGFGLPWAVLLVILAAALYARRFLRH